MTVCKKEILTDGIHAFGSDPQTPGDGHRVWFRKLYPQKLRAAPVGETDFVRKQIKTKIRRVGAHVITVVLRHVQALHGLFVRRPNPARRTDLKALIKQQKNTLASQHTRQKLTLK